MIDKNFGRKFKVGVYSVVSLIGITCLTLLPDGLLLSAIGGVLTGYGLPSLGYTCAEMILLPRIEFLEEKLKNKQ